MPYSDESSAMLIKDKFNISKAAFKACFRAFDEKRKIVSR